MEKFTLNNYVEGPFLVSPAEMERARVGVNDFERLLLQSRGKIRDYLIDSNSGRAIQAVMLGIKPACIPEGDSQYSDAFGEKVAEYLFDCELSDKYDVVLGNRLQFFLDLESVDNVIKSHPDIFLPDLDSNMDKIFDDKTRYSRQWHTMVGLLLGFPPEAVSYFTKERTWEEKIRFERARKTVDIPGFTYAVGKSYELNTPFTRKVEHIFKASGMNALVDIHSGVSAPRFFKI